MAITITQSPQKITPSDNPIVFAFNQETTDGSNLKYNVSFIVNVYVTNANIGTFEIFPETSNGLYMYGKIDISDKVRAYITNHSVDGILTLVTYDPQNYAEVYIDVTEKYSIDPLVDPVINVSTTEISGMVYPFKSSLSRTEFKNFDYTDYKKLNGTKKYLTDKYSFIQGNIRRYTATQKKGDTTILSWFENTDLDTPVEYRIRIDYNWTGGSFVQYYTITTGIQGVIRAIRFNLDEQLALGNITQSTYDNCTTVQIGLTDEIGLSLRGGRYIITYSSTCFDKGSNVLWLNKYGSYDNFRFTYNSRFKARIESKSYSKLQGEWNASGDTYNVNNNTFGKIDYLKTITKQLELSSDWLDEVTQNWLVQLYESPLIYLNQGTEVENVVITDSAYQLKQSEHDELFNEIVNIEFTDKKSITL